MAYVFEILILYLVCITAAAYVSLLERKLIARIQLRIGPSLCGPCGILQPIADAVKLLLKRRPMANCTTSGIIGVVLLFSTSLGQFALIPTAGSSLQFRYGLLVVMLCHSLTTLAEILIGVASKSKYGVIGGARAYLQGIGSSLPLLLAVVAIMITTKCVDLDDIVCMSFEPFTAIRMLLLGAVFFIVMLMSIAKCPFDFIEAESEIVAGAYVEYGGVMFAMIYLADYLNLLFASAIIATIFMGGYGGAGMHGLLPHTILAVKILLITCLIILIRAILPRMRQDQMFRLSLWYLTPLLFVYIVVCS